MKKPVLAYIVLFSQVALILAAVYNYVLNLATKPMLFTTTKVHLNLQLILSFFIVFACYGYIKNSLKTATMRRAAGQKNQMKSKRIQRLILFLIGSIIFYSLYFTVPMNKYIASGWEKGLYIFTAFVGLILLVQLMGQHDTADRDFVKSKQKYAGIGAALGLILFYTYYQLLT